MTPSPPAHPSSQTLRTSTKKQLVSASSSAANVIKKGKLSPFLLISESAREEFEPYYSKQENILSKLQPSVYNSSVNFSKKQEIVNAKNLEVLKEFDSVFVGMSKRDFNFEKMNIAFHILHYNKGSKLYAINMSRYFKDTDGLNAISVGSFVKTLEFSSDLKPILIGKPSPLFFQSGMDVLGEGIETTNCAMIGDDVRDDVMGGMALGMAGVLVKTGKYKDGDENEFEKCKKQFNSPFWICDSFDHAVERIIRHNQIFSSKL